MTTRTSTKTVVFTRPFFLAAVGKEQPAGAYLVETDEELLPTLATTSYKRVRTLIHLHEIPGDPRITGIATIDPDELDAALAADSLPQKGSSP